MSVASRQRECDRITQTNARTPEWAKDQIRRQNTFHAAFREYRGAPMGQGIVEKLTLESAFVSAWGAISVIWRKKKVAPVLSKTEMRTKA